MMKAGGWWGYLVRRHAQRIGKEKRIDRQGKKSDVSFAYRTRCFPLFYHLFSGRHEGVLRQQARICSTHQMTRIYAMLRSLRMSV